MMAGLSCLSRPSIPESETDGAKGPEKHKCQKMLLSEPQTGNANQEDPAGHAGWSVSRTVSRTRRRTSIS